MSSLTLVDENTFQGANQSDVADRKAQLLLYLSGNGIDTSFSKLNTSTNRAKKSLPYSSVMELVDQYFSVMIKDAKREWANAWVWQE